jgi:hypothetical protein
MWLRNLFTEPQEIKNDARRRNNVTEVTAATKIFWVTTKIYWIAFKCDDRHSKWKWLTTT